MRTHWILRAAVVGLLLGPSASSRAGFIIEYQHDRFLQPGEHGHVSHWSWRGSPPDNVTAIEVSYFIHDHGGPATITDAMKDRIRDAAAVWSRANSGALINLVERSGGFHIHNRPIDGPGGALGLAAVGYSTGHQSPPFADGHSWHRIGGAVVEFDSAENWYTGTGNPGSQFDYFSVMLHELGHAIGLGHADGTEQGSPMLPSIAPGQVRRTLTAGDRIALQHLYGTAVPEAIPEPGSFVLFAVGALGLLAYARRPKKGAELGDIQDSRAEPLVCRQ